MDGLSASQYRRIYNSAVIMAVVGGLDNNIRGRAVRNRKDKIADHGGIRL